jgi:hypothetical protein
VDEFSTVQYSSSPNKSQFGDNDRDGYHLPLTHSLPWWALALHSAAVQHRIYDNVAGAPLRVSYAMLAAARHGMMAKLTSTDSVYCIDY